jgi:hypothetical protein
LTFIRADQADVLDLPLDERDLRHEPGMVGAPIRNSLLAIGARLVLPLRQSLDHTCLPTVGVPVPSDRHTSVLDTSVKIHGRQCSPSVCSARVERGAVFELGGPDAAGTTFGFGTIAAKEE